MRFLFRLDKSDQEQPTFFVFQIHKKMNYQLLQCKQTAGENGSNHFSELEHWPYKVNDITHDLLQWVYFSAEQMICHFVMGMQWLHINGHWLIMNSVRWTVWTKHDFRLNIGCSPCLSNTQICREFGWCSPHQMVFDTLWDAQCILSPDWAIFCPIRAQ